MPVEDHLADDADLTETLLAKAEVEEDVQVQYKLKANRDVRLGRVPHRNFAGAGLARLPERVCYLDSSRTWLAYWNLNSMALLGFPVGPEDGAAAAAPGVSEMPTEVPSKEAVVRFVESCFVEVVPGKVGAFGGGPNQIPHLAPTYSATLALLNIGTDEALQVLKDRRHMLREWFLTLKQPDGSCVMHEGGEVDVRACYCMLIVAVLIGIDDDEVRSGIVGFVASCQTYEGGFGCKPYEEAHGGYTYCSTAALAVLRRLDAVDMRALKRWLSRRQDATGCGFNGRTNKLIDACYAFWIGAAFTIVRGHEADARAEEARSVADLLALDQLGYAAFEDTAEATLQRVCAEQAAVDAVVDETKPSGTEAPEAKQAADSDDWVDEETPVGQLGFDQEMLQRFLLNCCQQLSGGMMDKPSVSPDYYHTNYALSGLSLSQNLAKAYHTARLGASSSLSGTATEAGHTAAATAAVTAERKELLLKALQGADTSNDAVLYSNVPGSVAGPAASVLRLLNPVFSIRREYVQNGLMYFHGGRKVLPDRKPL